MQGPEQEGFPPLFYTRGKITAKQYLKVNTSHFNCCEKRTGTCKDCADFLKHIVNASVVIQTLVIILYCNYYRCICWSSYLCRPDTGCIKRGGGATAYSLCVRAQNFVPLNGFFRTSLVLVVLHSLLFYHHLLIDLNKHLFSFYFNSYQLSKNNRHLCWGLLHKYISKTLVLINIFHYFQVICMIPLLQTYLRGLVMGWLNCRVRLQSHIKHQST